MNIPQSDRATDSGTRSGRGIWGIVLLAVLAGMAAGIWLAKPDATKPAASSTIQKQLYTCGMHPQVIQDHPGNCPICGMKLTPVRGGGAAGLEPQAIQLDPATIQTTGIRTTTVTRGPLRRVIRTVGTVDYNETAVVEVTTKFKGWIEKLYVNATGQETRKGDPLFEIYSPELYVAQSEYVLALSASGSDAGDTAALRASARNRLSFADVSDDQIAELERTRQPRKTVRVLSPQDGFAIEKNIVEGQMVDAGMRLYRLANLGSVWIQAQVYEQDLPHVKPGQEAVATLTALPGREFKGRVDYVYPSLDEQTRTARIRLEINNPGHLLKPGMYAAVTARSEAEASALLAPGMAILRSGERCTVFVALENGRFEARTVTLGLQAEDDMYQVVNGLREGERIVTSGQFMLDSESQLREAVQKMQEFKAGSSMPARMKGGDSDTAAKAEDADSRNALTLYTCPMAEHADVVSDKPGDCPKCGMKLVPARTVPHGNISEATWRRNHAPQGKAAAPGHDS